jgi:hypothetical protein
MAPNESERDDANLRGWHERGMLHLEHNHMLI